MVNILDFIIAFFLGELGIYRLYKGHTLTAIIWFFTGGFFFIGWLIDWIYVLQGKY